ncbi:MAG: winged helix-turn-helix domain-containing protein [Methylococcaceae bacterium]
MKTIDHRDLRVVTASNLTELDALIEKGLFDILVVENLKRDSEISSVTIEDLHSSILVKLTIKTPKTAKTTQFRVNSPTPSQKISPPDTPPSASQRKPKPNDSGLSQKDGRTIGWMLDLNSRRLVSPDQRALDLSPCEISKLRLLITEPGRLVTVAELAETMNLGLLNYHARIYTQVSRLRQKLKAFDDNLTIYTWRNTGYTFSGPSIELRPHTGIKALDSVTVHANRP